MGNPDDEPTESPATWENVAVGKAKEVVGRAIGDEELTEEGDEQEAIAHEVREEFKEEHKG
ncbi:MAG: CsbD family protein [Jatrophihabitantaceae bacterium]